jgi:pyrroline-5-carboxylate reductase
MKFIIIDAVQLGFNESEAAILVNQTFMGSLAIQNAYSLSNQEWIIKVTSKGGTTESAFEIFQQN